MQFKTMILYFILLPICLLSQSSSHDKSTIILPIEINLTQIEAYLNETIPQTLNEIKDIDRICVKPQYLKTKGIPKCRMDNLKISCTSQTIKIQTIPEIRCDILGWVKRDGNLSVSGEGNKLTFAFPIHSKITVKSHIDSTATAAAIVYIDASPRINSDWSLGLDIKPTFVWSKKPTLTVLDGIEISIQNRVEHRLQKRLDKFVKKLPKRLAKVDLKERVAQAWQKMQDPIKIDTHTQTYLQFKPETLSYSGFRVIQHTLMTTLSITGETEIVLGTLPKTSHKVPLSPLENIPFQEGKFRFNLPISMSYNELQLLLERKFETGYRIDFTQSTLPGIITLTQPKIDKTSTGKLQISAHIQYDNHTSWLHDIEGNITFQGIPKIDKENQTIVLENLSYNANSNSEIFDSLVNIAEVKPLNMYLTHLMKFNYAPKLEKGIQKANKALKSISKKNMQLSASLKIASIDKLSMDEEKITLFTTLSGVVQTIIDLKPNELHHIQD